MAPPSRASARRKRRDSWAVYPVVQAIVFTVCAGYLTFSGVLWGPLFGPQFVEVDNYLSPLFSPLILFPDMPTWLSPGLLILWIPIGFRATCYYYRKAYYRFYFADPPGCAVGEPTVHRKFALENALPFVLQNLHRYLLYLAFIPLFFLWIDVFVGFLNPDEVTGAWQPRIGLGGVVLLAEHRAADAATRCRATRCGTSSAGRIDCFSCTAARRVRYTLWQRLTDFNRNHMWWAWTSLITVTFADIYVRALQAGVITDLQIRSGSRARAARGTRSGGGSTRSRRIPSTSSSSGPAAPGSGPRSRPRPRARRSGSCASRCSGRPTRSWPRAASRRPSATWTPRTSGRPTSATRWSAGSSSTTRGWPSSTPRRRPTGSASSRPGARSSTERATGGSSSGRSAATRTRGSRTSATGPGSR